MDEDFRLPAELAAAAKGGLTPDPVAALWDAVQSGGAARPTAAIEDADQEP